LKHVKSVLELSRALRTLLPSFLTQQSVHEQAETRDVQVDHSDTSSGLEDPLVDRSLEPFPYEAETESITTRMMGLQSEVRKSAEFQKFIRYYPKVYLVSSSIAND
jgi:hypothetical protein